MATEPAPAFEASTEDLSTNREIVGTGFDELSRGLETKKIVLLGTLLEKRPLHLVADYSGKESSVKDLLVECLGLTPEESEFVTAIKLDNLSEQKAQEIIDDGLRPNILPIIIGAGENPKWWVGPVWKFYSPGNVGAFRDQLTSKALSLMADR